MSDERISFAVERFEQVAAGTGIVLLRLSGVWRAAPRDGGETPTLVIAGEHVRPLPSPDDQVPREGSPWRAAFSASTALVERADPGTSAGTGRTRRLADRTLPGRLSHQRDRRMIGSFTFENLPCRVVFGSGTLASAKAEIERLGGKRALVLTTPQQEAEGRASVRRSARSMPASLPAPPCTRRSRSTEHALAAMKNVRCRLRGRARRRLDDRARQGDRLAHRRQPALHSHHLCRLGDDADPRRDRERPEDHGARCAPCCRRS